VPATRCQPLLSRNRTLSRNLRESVESPPYFLKNIVSVFENGLFAFLIVNLRYYAILYAFTLNAYKKIFTILLKCINQLTLLSFGSENV
jgi:hypothetical protein